MDKFTIFCQKNGINAVLLILGVSSHFIYFSPPRAAQGTFPVHRLRSSPFRGDLSGYLAAGNAMD